MGGRVVVWDHVLLRVGDLVRARRIGATLPRGHRDQPAPTHGERLRHATARREQPDDALDGLRLRPLPPLSRDARSSGGSTYRRQGWHRRQETAHRVGVGDGVRLRPDVLVVSAHHLPLRRGGTVSRVCRQLRLGGV